MNILHINSHDLHGSRFNGYQMQYVIQGEHKVEMAVWDKTSNNSNVHHIPPSKNWLFNFLTQKIIIVTAKLGFDRLFGFGGMLLPFFSFYKRADIVHLHLIHNISNFSIGSLPNIGRNKPLVWTLHDPWAFTGGCEHSFDCEKWKSGCKGFCPHPRANSFFKRYIPFFHWKIKRLIYSKADLTLIVASKWMFDKVKASPLMSHYTCHLIPFGVDINLFRPMDKLVARKALGINETDKVLAFRDPGFHVDKFKGMKWLYKALEDLQTEIPITLLIFQDGKEFDKLSGKFKIIKTGWIKDLEMVEAMSAADLFLMPSIQESFGLMAIEAMACGLPVIVSEGSALPSIIKAPLGGISVPPKDSVALMNAIESLLINDEKRLKISIQARQLVEAEYSDQFYINKHIEVYELIINKFNLKNKRN
jgi:glycosyltransferase involved in cell wall biosynthesis